MVEYADFYVLIATLAPLFLLASFVGLARLAQGETNSFDRWLLLLIIGLTTFMSISVVYQALAILAGFETADGAKRAELMGLLGLQVLTGIGGVVIEAWTQAKK